MTGIWGLGGVNIINAPELILARIQLELEAFQLAWLVGFWAQLVLQIIWQNELLVLFVNIKICTNDKILFH